MEFTEVVRPLTISNCRGVTQELQAQSPQSPPASRMVPDEQPPDSPESDIETIELLDSPPPTRHPDSPPPLPRESWDESDEDVLDDDDDQLMAVEQELLGDLMDVDLVEILLASSPGLRNDPDYTRIGSRVCRVALTRLLAGETPAHEIPAIVGVMACLWDVDQLTAEEHAAAVEAVLALAATQPTLRTRAFRCCWRIALAPDGQDMLGDAILAACVALESEPSAEDNCRMLHTEAATVLWNSCAGHQVNAAAARASGAVEGLIAIQTRILEEWGKNLNRTDTVKLAAAASGALWGLVYEGKSDHIERCVVPSVRLLQLLSETPSVVKPALGVVSCACAGCPQAVAAAVSAGVSQIVKIIDLKDREDTVNALQLYVHVLAGTAQHRHAQEHFVGLVDAGLPEQLCAVLRQYREDPDVTSRALGCVQRVSQWRHVEQLTPCAQLAVDAMLQHGTVAGGKVLLMRGCGVLRNLAANDYEAQTELSEMEGSIEALLSSFEQPGDDEELLVAALEAIRAVVYRHVPARERCIAAGVLKHVVGVLGSRSSRVSESACKLLWNLCVHMEPQSVVYKGLIENGLEDVLDGAEEQHADSCEVFQCVNDVKRLFGLKCESPIESPETSP